MYSSKRIPTHTSIRRSVRPHTCLSAHPSAFLSNRLPVYRPTRLPAHSPLVYLPTCLSAHTSIHPSVYPHTLVSAQPPICLRVYPPTRLSSRPSLPLPALGRERVAIRNIVLWPSRLRLHATRFYRHSVSPPKHLAVYPPNYPPQYLSTNPSTRQTVLTPTRLSIQISIKLFMFFAPCIVI
jgi:hypothetical protein